MSVQQPRVSDAFPHLPAGAWLAYYGDDFTGSTDVMDAFAHAGIPTVLFLRTPDARWIERFAHMRCVGLAGTARGHSPAWMREHLPAAFASLRAFGAPLLQYKVCSTFDSSPDSGSIGQAIDLGLAAMGGTWSPMVIGAPRLRRYQAFGHLFAAMGETVHRLDRHPTMSRHPVTPMPESDLRRHLAHQTSRRLELIDLVTLHSGRGNEALARLQDGAEPPVVLLDVVDDQTLAEAGRVVWEGRGQGLFSASSSGLEYALVAHWRRTGALGAGALLPQTQPAASMVAVSGSCSPVTAAQIAWAQRNGFSTERLVVDRLLDARAAEAEVARVVAQAVRALEDGLQPLIYSASGPDDPHVQQFPAAASHAGIALPQAHALVGRALARCMQQVIAQTGVRRVAIAGGDSSGAVASALDITALTVLSQLAPGAPLCRAWSDVPAMDGLEVVLKGGQMGAEDFFGQVLNGTVA